LVVPGILRGGAHEKLDAADAEIHETVVQAST
jgi:hypothetical protein